MPLNGILIVGHGSRDGASNADFEALVARCRLRHPTAEVAHGYVELAAPALPVALATLAARAEHVVVAPLFLFAAGHVKTDLPVALDAARREFPRVRFTAARALGVHPGLADLAFERARAALSGKASVRDAALIVVGRGSSDPDANGDFCKVVRLVAEGRDFGWVLPSFIGITRPSFGEALELAARARPGRIVVVPYLLFAGRLVDKLEAEIEAFRARCPWIPVALAGTLGPDERLLTVIDDRIAEATGGERPLPCDTCQYRAPISGVTTEVGGLRALLYSVRHGFTHAQATPHVHAHRPPKKHVLVCTNADCADRGSLSLLAALRRLLKDAGREREVRVTKTLCMGRCGEGPTVAVYPDGVWYRGVLERDAEDLVREHLLGDRLVGRLVDSILH